MDPFYLTDSAAARINTLKAQEGKPDLRFRILVKGGGCSGFQYEFSLDGGELGAADAVFAHLGVEVVLDDISLDIVKGSTLDYTEDMAQAGFVIKNPNATAKCGCGNSFSVAL